MIAMLCNASGETMLGTDTFTYVDGRKTVTNRLLEVRDYRNGFKANFRHKFDYWTHVYFVKRIRDRTPADTLHPIE